MTQIAHNAHRSTAMKRQFFNIDVSISKGHQKKVRNIEPKCQADQFENDLLTSSVIHFPQQTHDSYNRNKRQRDIEKVPKSKERKDLSPLFV